MNTPSSSIVCSRLSNWSKKSKIHWKTCKIHPAIPLRSPFQLQKNLLMFNCVIFPTSCIRNQQNCLPYIKLLHTKISKLEIAQANKLLKFHLVLLAKLYIFLIRHTQWILRYKKTIKTSCFCNMKKMGKLIRACKWIKGEGEVCCVGTFSCMSGWRFDGEFLDF